MEIVRILLGGAIGEIGREIVKQVKNVDGIEIAAGVNRVKEGGVKVMQSDADGLYPVQKYDFESVEKWYTYRDIIDPIKCPSKDFDAFVDFSNVTFFDEVLDVAVRTHVPLISGTSGLSNYQMRKLYDATDCIPVFRGGIFHFGTKRFIDAAVEFVREHEGQIDLYESFYTGYPSPSEASKVLERKIFEATRRRVNVHSTGGYSSGNWIFNWELQIHKQISATNVEQHKLQHRVIGIEELAHDVLEIVKVMARKSTRRGEFYDLDEIWDDIPEAAKNC